VTLNGGEYLFDLCLVHFYCLICEHTGSWVEDGLNLEIYSSKPGIGRRIQGREDPLILQVTGLIL